MERYLMPEVIAHFDVILYPQTKDGSLVNGKEETVSIMVWQRELESPIFVDLECINNKRDIIITSTGSVKIGEYKVIGKKGGEIKVQFTPTNLKEGDTISFDISKYLHETVNHKSRLDVRMRKGNEYTYIHTAEE